MVTVFHIAQVQQFPGYQLPAAFQYYASKVQLLSVLETFQAPSSPLPSF